MQSPYFVLCVDDDESTRDFISSVIEETPYQCLKAESGSHALALLAEKQDAIVLVISDYAMPEMNGLEFRQQMMKNWGDTPFAFLTGCASKELAINAISYKISAFFEKPIQVKDFQQRVISIATEQIGILKEKQDVMVTYLEEAWKQLEEIETQVGALANDPNNLDIIDAIFRQLHTIKGSSGYVGARNIEQYAHHYEDLLGGLKRKTIPVTKSIIQILFSGYDQLTDLLNEFQSPTGAAYNIPQLVKIFAIDPDKIFREYNEAADKQQTTQNNKAANSDNGHFISTHLLDEFLELSSELTVIRNSMRNILQSFNQTTSENPQLDLLFEAFDGMQKISGQIQTKIVELRKVSLNSVLKGLPRVVRDIAKTNNKTINFSIEGGDLQVDKRISQVLANVLIHMIRNACDHGIESTEQRLKLGKSPEGALTLKAKCIGEDVIVEIGDDGQGLDANLIKAKALEKKLYQEEDLVNMAEQRVYQILFESGFSTAQTITSISGRGVGMDMVKSTIEAAKGSIEIQSELGKGTTFNLVIPVPKYVLIVDSLIFRSGTYQFAVPIESVRSIATKRIATTGQKPFVKHEESVIFVWDIPCLIENRDNSIKADQDHLVLLIHDHGVTTGFAIDECLGQFEIVIRPFDQFLRSFDLFKGTALLDNSKMCLVIDPEKMVNLATHKDPTLAGNRKFSPTPDLPASAGWA